jgi:hypothetical protein
MASSSRVSLAARKSDGARNLRQALAALILSQASLVENQAAFLLQLSETHQRLARIESDLEQIKAILRRHDQILSDLPEVIRQEIRQEIRREIGFKSSSGSGRSQSS